jgi:hypothetical protein
MAIIIDDKIETMVQGITGTNAALHTKFMLAYGTKIVGGVTPGKAGQRVFLYMIRSRIAWLNILRYEYPAFGCRRGLQKMRSWRPSMPG